MWSDCGIAGWENLYSVKNIVTQKKKSLLFLTLFFVMAVISYLFWGELFLYRDDRITRKSDDTIFAQQQDNRILVRKNVTGEDLSAGGTNDILTNQDLKQVKKISHVEAADLYGYANEISYCFDLQGGEKREGFVSSETMLDEKALSVGRLPEKRDEIVMYSDSGELLGQSVNALFSAENNWGKEEKYQAGLVVVGLLKKKTNQVYFHGDFCRMLTIPLANGNFTLQYGYDRERKTYLGEKQILPVISSDLTGNTVRISADFELPYDVKKEWNTLEETLQSGGVITLGDGEEMSVRFDTSYSDQGDIFVEVSEEFFEKIYGADTTELSVYLSHYKYTDRVVKKLEKMGYDAVSTYRVSRGDYDKEKVYQRLQMMGISGLMLSFGFLLCFFLLPLLLKLDEREYQIFFLLGLSKQKIGQMLYGQMMILAVIGYVVGNVVCHLLSVLGISMFFQVKSGITFFYWCVLVCYQMGVLLVPVTVFVRKKGFWTGG
jgi:hypothetical protein